MKDNSWKYADELWVGDILISATGLPIEIKYSSKECVDIEYKGKTARFTGDEARIGFRADASSMKWLLPERNASVSQKDRDE